MATAERDDVQAVLDETVAEIEQLSWRALDAFEDATDDVSAPSGRRFRVRRMTYWDIEPWASDLWIVVEARPIDGSTDASGPTGSGRSDQGNSYRASPGGSAVLWATVRECSLSLRC